MSGTSNNLQTIELVYNRNDGFKNFENLDKLATESAAELLLNHTGKIEKDTRFRDITYKTILKILFVFSFIVLLALWLLANFISGLICFSMLLGLTYFVGYLHGKKLKTLIEEYNLKMAGTDWDYFGCYIEHRFGKKAWWFYIVFPFIRPTISLLVRYKPKPLQAGINQRNNVEIDSTAILTKLRNAEQAGGPSIPIKEKDLRAMLNKRYNEPGVIEVGGHEVNLDLQKRTEKERLFS